MDIAEAWETAWNADGTQMTLTVPADALNGQHTVNLIIFRLMDTDGNLIGGIAFGLLILESPARGDVKSSRAFFVPGKLHFRFLVTSHWIHPIVA